MTKISMTVNGEKVGPHEVPDTLAMVDYLNDYLGLTGTKFSCGIGVCHACVVMVEEADGSMSTQRTCINGAVTFDGMSVHTVEGHAKGDQLSPVQQAYVDHFSFQCGYCTSGFVNAGTALVHNLSRTPVARDKVEDAVSEALGEHICRCTGYVRYYEALRDYILATPALVQEG